jgi:hypothetical protein
VSECEIWVQDATHCGTAKLTREEETNLSMHFEDRFKRKMEKKEQWLGRVVLARN